MKSPRKHHLRNHDRMYLDASTIACLTGAASHDGNTSSRVGGVSPSGDRSPARSDLSLLSSIEDSDKDDGGDGGRCSIMSDDLGEVFFTDDEFEAGHHDEDNSSISDDDGIATDDAGVISNNGSADARAVEARAAAPSDEARQTSHDKRRSSSGKLVGEKGEGGAAPAASTASSLSAVPLLVAVTTAEGRHGDDDSLTSTVTAVQSTASIIDTSIYTASINTRNIDTSTTINTAATALPSITPAAAAGAISAATTAAKIFGEGFPSDSSALEHGNRKYLSSPPSHGGYMTDNLGAAAESQQKNSISHPPNNNATARIINGKSAVRRKPSAVIDGSRNFTPNTPTASSVPALSRVNDGTGGTIHNISNINSGGVIPPSGAVPRVTCKVLVVGNAKCGKSSIISRFISDRFSSEYNSTVGADYAKKDVALEDGRQVRLQLWDIAGQDRFAKLTRAYFRKAKGAVVVCDVTREGTFDAIVRWKEEIDFWCQNERCNLPVYLFANKSDLLTEVQDSFLAGARMEKTCREAGFTAWHITSAKRGDNIDQAMTSLIQDALEVEGRQKNDIQGGAQGARQPPGAGGGLYCRDPAEDAFQLSSRGGGGRDRKGQWTGQQACCA